MVRWAWKLHLELKLPDCIFPCVAGLAAVPQGCGFWRQSCLFWSWGVYGLLWFWHTVPVSASPQMHGLSMKVSCGTRVCSQSLRAAWALSLVAFSESPSKEDGAKVWLACSPFCWYKAANILFQVGIMMKMCWTLERDILNTQSSLQA